MTNICFVSLNSYPIIAEFDMPYVGGAEIQQVILAKELLKHEYNISMITYDEGQPEVEYVSGIKVIKTYKRDMAPLVNIVSKTKNIWHAMAEANADIYYHSAGSAGIVGIFCKILNKKFVHQIPSDANVSKYLRFIDFNWFSKLIEYVDIILADAIIAQNKFQKTMLKNRFKRESVIINNVFPLTPSNLAEKKDPPIILWAATVGEIKQPYLFLELAKSIPEAKFQLIGGIGTDLNLYKNIEKISKNIPNLIFEGFIPFSRIEEYYKSASIFVNTSRFEGFPNTFIQAWMNFVPVISLNVDPDCIICKNNLGYHSVSFAKMIEDIKALINDKNLREKLGQNCRNYVEKNHNVSIVIGEYIEVFGNLTK